jgi:acetyltransferase-like isoleucine patch superfamily enzyme
MLFKNFAGFILFLILLTISGPVFGYTIAGTMKFGGEVTQECGVTIWVDYESPVGWTGCDPAGNWVSPDLPPGTYYLTAHGESWGFVSELYDGFDGIACPWEACVVTDGLEIELLDSDAGGIAFDLVAEERIYQVSGSVLASDDSPVGGMVRLYNALGGPIQDMWTYGEDGNEGLFHSEPLAAGTYYATTTFTDGVLDEAWYEVPCANQMCDLLAEATPIVVPSAGNDGLHFRLEPVPDGEGGHIGGQVRGPDGPLPNVGIEIRNARGEGLFWVGTDSEGYYQTQRVANDIYYVVAHNEQLGLRPEIWDDIPCIEEWHCWDPGFISAHGSDILVSNGDRLDIDFDLAMPPGGLISGQLIDADTGLPVMGGWMVLIEADTGNFLRGTGANGSGMYWFSGLAPGNYKVLAEGVPEGYMPELYGGDHCPGPCDPNGLGDVVVIEDDTTVASETDIYLDFEGMRIVGQITRSDTGEPVNGHEGWVGVELHRADGHHLGGFGANEAGLFEIRPDGPGDYYLVATNDMERHHLINEVWEDIPCIDDCHPFAVEGAGLVTLGEGETVVVNFELDPGYRISGTLVIEWPHVWDGWINIWNAAGEHVAGMGHDGMGNWMSPVLPQGSYYATAHGESFGFVSELYDDIACPWEACDVTGGNPIELLDADVDGILFDLDPESDEYEISGWVRDALGHPVGGMVRLHNVLGWPISETWTDHEGRFWSEPLAAGTYYATTMHTGMLDEAWNDVPCVNQVCDPVKDGTPITVPSAGNDALHFVLDPITAGGHIGGRLLGPDGPVGDSRVEIRNANGEHLTGVVTNSEGYYRTGRLAADQYYVIAQNERLGLGREIWDDVACSEDWQCRESWYIREHGTPVDLTGGDRPDIDFDLAYPPGGRISGQLIDAGSGLPVMGGWMALIDVEAGHPVRGIPAAGDGRYWFSGLAPGRYKVLAEWPPEGYMAELYGGDHCPGPCDHVGIGTEIVIENDTTVASGKDILLDFEGTRIVGQVLRGDTGEPVNSNVGWVNVELFGADGDLRGSWGANEAGLFDIRPGPGDYRLFARNAWWSHYLMNQVWGDEAPCLGDCDPLSGEVVTLDEGQTLVADFILTPMERVPPAIERRAEVHPSASVGDGSIIEENVVIGPFAQFGSNAYVVKNAQIAAFCFISYNVHIGQNSVLEPGCFVGHDAFIDKGVRLGEASSVGPYSIIGKDVQIGDFAEIRDHVELGKSVVVAPGVCIESGTMVPKDGVVETSNCN